MPKKIKLKVNSLSAENYKLRHKLLKRRTCEDLLMESCYSDDKYKLIIDILALVASGKDMKFQILRRNIVWKMKSGSNHKFSSIIKDISSMYLIKLGAVN